MLRRTDRIRRGQVWAVSLLALGLTSARAPRARPMPTTSSAPATSSAPVVLPRTPDLSGPWGQRLVAIETELYAEARKPPLDANWEPFLGRLLPLAWQREEPVVARLAAAWQAQLRDRIADQKTGQSVAEIVQRAARERAEHEREMARLQQWGGPAAPRPGRVRGPLSEIVVPPAPPATTRPAQSRPASNPVTRPATTQPT